MTILRRFVPGIALCAAISAAALAIEATERRLAGQAVIESIVLAILVGAAVRAVWRPGDRWTPGIAVSARLLLEIAVVLLGASVSVQMLRRTGPALAVGTLAVVAVSIGASYALSRAFGLHHRLALLVACGNSICGNSAIAAVAPVIDAEADDIASSIAFTAILGVAVVLTLPLLARALGYSAFQYGVLAGLSVYAVPQVLAATLPVSALSAQVGTLVKLVRVLMLGPVVVTLALAHRPAGDTAAARRPSLVRLVPWFIIGFVVLAVLRSAGAISETVAPVLRTLATILTVLSMAALGLGVDFRVLRRAGSPVTRAVVASLAVLIAISVALIAALRLS